MSDSLTAGQEGWFNNKPVRFAPDYKLTSEEMNSLDVNDQLHPKLKMFLACVVWNYETKSMQYWQMTQKTFIKNLMSLRLDKDWGGLTKHDLKIGREGKGLSTEYTIQPSPGDTPKEAIEAFKESKLDAKHFIEDEKNKENLANFRSSLKTDKKDDKEIKPGDIPF